MYPVSQAFLDALGESHRAVSKVEVRTQAGSLINTMYPSSGSISANRTAAVRRTCRFDVDADAFNYSLTDPDNLLHPLSFNELHPYRGIRLSPTTVEWVPLGVYGITSTTINDTGDSYTMTVEGKDRSREVQRAGLVNSYTIAAGTNYGTAIEGLIEDRRPNRFTFSFASISAVTPELVFGGPTGGNGDPWKQCVDMAESVAHDVFFDRVGVCVLQPQPTTASPIAYTVAEGANGVLLSASRKHAISDTFNHIVVYGEAPDEEPVRGEAYDDDVTSPTYVGSPVGTGAFYNPESMQSEYVTSVTQADELAEARLRQTLSSKVNASFESIVNPALEVGDIIAVTRVRLQLPAKFVLEELVIPLESTRAMRAVLQEARV